MASRKSTASAKACDISAHVLAAAKSFRKDDLADALGKLTVRRLKQPAAAKLQPYQRQMQRWSNDKLAAVAADMAAPKPRRSGARRVGFKRYETTTKVDMSRFGTFRRYMLTTIRAHSDTVKANDAHMLCDNPKFAKNKLDFNWAADNGYIRFI